MNKIGHGPYLDRTLGAVEVGGGNSQTVGHGTSWVLEAVPRPQTGHGPHRRCVDVDIEVDIAVDVDNIVVVIMDMGMVLNIAGGIDVDLNMAVCRDVNLEEIRQW